MRKRLNSAEKPVVEQENIERKFVVWKRCGKAIASDIITLPHIDGELKYTSFTEGKGMKLEQGDIVNTVKQNQLLIVLTVKIDPTVLLDIKESGFEPDRVIARNILDSVDSVRIKEKQLDGKDVFVINKKVYTYPEIKDAARLLYFPDSIVNSIHYDSEDKSAVLPSVVYNILGSIQSRLFPKLYEEKE